MSQPDNKGPLIERVLQKPNIVHFDEIAGLVQDASAEELKWLHYTWYLQDLLPWGELVAQVGEVAESCVLLSRTIAEDPKHPESWRLERDARGEVVARIVADDPQHPESYNYRGDR